MILEILNRYINHFNDPDNDLMTSVFEKGQFSEEKEEAVTNCCAQIIKLLEDCKEQFLQDDEEYEDSVDIDDELNSLAELSYNLMKTNNIDLIKTASVLDEILLTIAASPDVTKQIKKSQENKIKEIKRKYEEFKNSNRYKRNLESEAKIKDAPVSKDYKILQHSLSTRYCPDHPGVPTLRLEEDVWQCTLDKKIYNYQSGYTLENNSKVPGSSVSEQRGFTKSNTTSMFDTREERIKNQY